MFKKVSASTNLNEKAKMSFRVFRAKTNQWEELGLQWQIKQFIRESWIQFLNLFRKNKGYATVLKQVGEEWIVDKLDETVQTTGDYISWGIGAGTHTKTNPANALFIEAAETRVVGTRTQPLADKIRWVGTITSLSEQTITNAGNFTDITSGTLIVAGDFTGIPLNMNDKIEFTIDLEIT